MKAKALSALVAISAAYFPYNHAASAGEMSNDPEIIKSICTPNIKMTQLAVTYGGNNGGDSSTVYEFITISRDNGMGWVAHYENGQCMLDLKTSGIVRGNSKVVTMKCSVDYVTKDNTGQPIVSMLQSCR
ncbi:hypothetical protein [Nitrospirillum sp. BR 11163]|uniref:hypothetical protein n=1 Tax=Nitrospirillum sp. BR 11163 TaxID=3104323 RepID=UPI002AFFD3AD|nr:hypothetical protein [Nitrospirillum sp. BR 11163]MEA1674367.1 hypothetical protein [Nitrospirillum sp. BR 11163]